MKKRIIEFGQGVLIGISNLIPGFSGGTMALILGIYEWFTEAIALFTKRPWQSIKKLWSIGLGMVIGIIIATFTIAVCLAKWPIITSSFFVGLVIATIPITIKKIEKRKPSFGAISSFLICFVISLLLPFSSKIGINININNVSPLIIIFITVVAALAAATMIIPAASGSMILLAFGIFNPIVLLLKDTLISIKDGNLQSIGNNCLIIIPFIMGAVIGVLLIAKLINYLFKKHDMVIWYGILGLLLTSIFTIYYNAYETHVLPNPSIVSSNIKFNVILSVIMFITGFFGLRILTNIANKKVVSEEKEEIERKIA